MPPILDMALCWHIHLCHLHGEAIRSLPWQISTWLTCSPLCIRGAGLEAGALRLPGRFCGILCTLRPDAASSTAVLVSIDSAE